MLSFGIEFSLAFWTALARAALPSGSPPPSFAATWIARASLVNRAPRLASAAPFLCLIELHLLWPDIGGDSSSGIADCGLRIALGLRIAACGGSGCGVSDRLVPVPCEAVDSVPLECAPAR